MSSNHRQPLPSRSSALDVMKKPDEVATLSARPRLTSGPTTAISSTSIQSHMSTERKDPKRPNFEDSKPSKSPFTGFKSDIQKGCHPTSHGSAHESSDLESTESYTPVPSDIDTRSLVEDMLERGTIFPAWKDTSNVIAEAPMSNIGGPGIDDLEDFWREFQSFSSPLQATQDEERLALEWRRKRKHFLVISQSGKPVWQRHGNDNFTSGYVAAIQMIISFYETSNDSLKSFTAGGSRFVVLSQGPLYLVAISKLGESEVQLRSQLDALYMQILSTLTLPNLERMFSLKPSVDLRRPLQGTENLLSALADSFTRGSPSTLLSSLECLRLRKRHRQSINDVLLRSRCSELLYGLIVAGGRLVSVVRPKTHSLHPGDMKLLFNMLFEADGIQATGGENWIPMCLPGFNSNGFLYLYVSYLDGDHEGVIQNGSAHISISSDPGERHTFLENKDQYESKSNRIAILLISSKREAFFELQNCRNNIIKSLLEISALQAIREAMERGRPELGEIAPGSPIQHFLYKSKGNLQLFMPAWLSRFENPAEKRRLMSMYENLHASVHMKSGHLKVHYAQNCDSTSLAWVTDRFELYCVTDPGISKNVIVTASNFIVKWIKKEEERIFIIGGAVF